MIEAPSFRKVERHIHEKGDPICCILFAPTFDRICKSDIIPRFEYLDNRAGKNIDFYCVGYMGYANKTDFPDMKEIGVSKFKDSGEIPWSFSQRKFSEFVDEMEENTSWKYSGGTELIILDSNADFTNTVIFKVDKMLKDDAIDNVNELLEALIQHSRKDKKTLEKFSLGTLGKKSSDILVESIIELLPKGLKSMSGIWTKGKHYTIDSIK
ncbi:hypothetical protein [Gelidibacter sp. F63206]|uniref:hypothetical protein n=1 Tax=Gelidibacter sp. F63206 TaxID=2926425 RepID=UPI001FF228D9|nr:hypothetical protein [Gelidibacter sp. F63206]MCK0115342.1 hypothetical protein [Gelidibacter sp. F63206]